jgi:hypothetical protein
MQPPLVLDPATEKLQTLAASTDWLTLAARSAHETASRVYSEFPPPQPILVGLAAAKYLQRIVPLVQADILAQHSAYGPVRWLWYLRRSPDGLFQGDYHTTLGYDGVLAEVLSAQFTSIDTSYLSDRVAFRVDSASFRHLARYVGRVKLLSQLHMLYRRVGKGAELDASRPVFMARTSDAIERALRIYDERHDRSHEFMGAGLGLASVDPNFEQLVEDGSAGEPVAFLSMACTPSFAAPVTYPDGAGGLLMATVQVRHVLKELNLSRILNPVGAGADPPEYLPGIAALTQLLMLVPAISAHVPWALSSICQQGYVFVGEQRLRAIADHHLPELVEQLAPHTPNFAWAVGFDQWHEALAAVHASVWPLSSGDVIRRFGDNLLLDTTGASQALLHRIELGRSPLLGNLRAREFELQCQDLIDGTTWSPPPDLRALRGRTLRAGGRALTDIDAIGTKNHSLLIVSCKSVIYDRDYDQGDYRAIRNSQTTVDQAVRDWEVIVAELRRQPRGENFNFSEFDEIVAVVCTPFAVYSDDERTLVLTKPKLRASSSMLELRDWLATN